MNSLVAQQQGYSFPMDEISRTYYPGRGFLTDQQAYPENPFFRSPRYSGGMNVPGAPGNLQTLPYYGVPTNPKQMPYYPEQDNSGVELLADMPRYIRGNFAPSGAIIKAPHIDSPYIDEQIRRGFVPMTPPPARLPGPQLFPLAQQIPAGFQNKYVS